MTTDMETQPPGLGRRLLAMVYDTLLVIALAMFLTAMFIAVSQGIGAGEADPAARRFSLQAVLFFGIFGFFCWFWRRQGQTLGMQAWRIRLVDEYGGKPSVRQCFVRYIAAYLSTFCLGLGYLWVLVDKNGLSWHDRLSQTRLVTVPRAEKKADSAGAG